MQENARHVARWMLSTFLGVSARKKHLFISQNRPVLRTRPKFRRESYEEANLLTTEIF